MLGGYSVIVPVLNKRAVVRRTLESIAASMAFFDQHGPGADQRRGEIVVVDDGSTDGTADVVREFARVHAGTTLVPHARSQGIGSARNAGVRHATGDVLLFCDGDDLFLPEHVLVAVATLHQSASRADASASPWMLRVGNRGHIVLPAFRPVAALRTAVRLRDAVHPYWKAVLGRSLAQTLAVRRVCHEWVEGFPEQAVYKFLGGCEDGAYAVCLRTFFRPLHVDMETVEYVRYPGNSLDLQMPRFRQPPGATPEVATPPQRDAHTIRARLETQKMDYLLDKWRLLGPPPLPGVMLNWTGVVHELLSRGRRADADRVVDQAHAAGCAVGAEPS